MGLKLRGAAHGAGCTGSIAGTSKALGSFWCTSCASPVSPSHADMKRIQEHLAGGSRQVINLSLGHSRAYIFQNRHPTWFSSSWLFSSVLTSTRHTERQPQSKNQAVKEAWLAALCRTGDKEHWHGWQECQAHPSSALALGLVTSPQRDSTSLATRPPQLLVPHSPGQDDAQTWQEGGRAAPGSAPGGGAIPTETREGMLLCS